MAFTKKLENGEVLIDGVLVVFGAEYESYLVDGKDEIVEYFLSTMDDNLEQHLTETGREVIKVADKQLITSIVNRLFPLCGNCYSYIYKAKVNGIFSTDISIKKVLLKVSFAEVTDDEGEITEFNL